MPYPACISRRCHWYNTVALSTTTTKLKLWSHFKLTKTRARHEESFEEMWLQYIYIYIESALYRPDSPGIFQPQQLTSWRHRMETFSALLAICAGNSPVPGEFPSQKPVICVWINGWVNNREPGDLRRYRAHYDVTVMNGCGMINLFVSCRILYAAHCYGIWLCHRAHNNHDSWGVGWGER